jgi:hypothetical protein
MYKITGNVLSMFVFPFLLLLSPKLPYQCHALFFILHILFASCMFSMQCVIFYTFPPPFSKMFAYIGHLTHMLWYSAVTSEALLCNIKVSLLWTIIGMSVQILLHRARKIVRILLSV